MVELGNVGVTVLQIKVHNITVIDQFQSRNALHYFVCKTYWTISFTTAGVASVTCFVF